MAKLNNMKYRRYNNLYPHEYKYILNFYKKGDKESIALLITEQIEMTSGLREFIADIIRGKAKRGKGETSCFDRDYEIYQYIEEMRSEDDAQSLSREKDGLFSLAAKINNVTKDAAITAYYKIKVIKDQHDKIR